MKDFVSGISLEAFRAEAETTTTPAMCPSAMVIEKNIPIYDGASVTEAIAPEWAGVIGQGPGVFVIKRAFADLGAIDRASDAFRAIIAQEWRKGLQRGIISPRRVRMTGSGTACKSCVCMIRRSMRAIWPIR